jgi:two-component system nitrate/nitrite response regulator NarL
MNEIRIVIAEDNSVYRDALKSLLESRKGYKVVAEANNGAELIEIVKNRKFDVIFTDIEMPVLGGIEAVARIRESGIKSLIIAITSYDYSTIHAQMENAGANLVLQKEKIGLDIFQITETFLKEMRENSCRNVI